MRGWVMILLVACAAGVMAQEEAQPKPCSDPAYRQFDFWLGSWVSKDADGNLQGENEVTKVMGECAIQENWTSGGGAFRGTSFNFYDARASRWHQTWIDNQGGFLLLEGGFDGVSMQLSGEAVDKDGAPIINRITWTPLGDGRVRQHWQVSRDGGETFEDAFDGYYERK